MTHRHSAQLRPHIDLSRSTYRRSKPSGKSYRLKKRVPANKQWIYALDAMIKICQRILMVTNIVETNPTFWMGDESPLRLELNRLKEIADSIDPTELHTNRNIMRASKMYATSVSTNCPTLWALSEFGKSELLK